MKKCYLVFTWQRHGRRAGYELTTKTWQGIDDAIYFAERYSVSPSPYSDCVHPVLVTDDACVVLVAFLNGNIVKGQAAI